MANILLTESCVRACPYCFAREYMAAAPRHGISWENLIYILDFLARSNEKRVSYLGGEPTLHPEFAQFVRYALERDFRVTVFTSGVVSKATLAAMKSGLAGVPVEKLGFVCNLNHPSICSEAELASVHRFLDAFGLYASPGHTLYRLDFDLQFLIDYVDRFSLGRHLRLGVAQPIPGQANACIPAAELPAMARRLVEFFPRYEAAKISINFDCGMPLCLFNAAELRTFYHLGVSNGAPQFACRPAIDIGPDLNVWACFPLHAVAKKSLRDFSYMSEVRQFFKKTQSDLRADGGLLPACTTCVFRTGGGCGGGCLARQVQVP